MWACCLLALNQGSSSLRAARMRRSRTRVRLDAGAALRARAADSTTVMVEAISAHAPRAEHTRATTRWTPTSGGVSNRPSALQSGPHASVPLTWKPFVQSRPSTVRDRLRASMASVVSPCANRNTTTGRSTGTVPPLMGCTREIAGGRYGATPAAWGGDAGADCCAGAGALAIDRAAMAGRTARDQCWRMSYTSSPRSGVRAGELACRCARLHVPPVERVAQW